MNEDKFEKISAIMDSGLERRETEQVLDRIETDPQAKASWQRYHLIGDAMRNSLPTVLNPNMAEKISQLLEHEPTVLAPKRQPMDIFKPLTAVAIAASVTAVAVLVFQNNEQSIPRIADPASTNNIASISTETDFSQNTKVATVSLADNVPTKVRTVKYDPNNNSNEAKRLNSYILNHNQFNSRMGIPGGTANARLVGHEANQ